MQIASIAVLSDQPDLAATAAAVDSFWRFSLSIYARPGVAEALIALQDRDGCDVNMVLFALWSGAVGRRRLGPEDVAAARTAIAGLAADIVAPLRRLRRTLRPAPDADFQEMRQRVLGLELVAERAVQRRLATTLVARDVAVAAGDRRAVADANLVACVGAEAAASLEAERLRTAVAELTRA